MVPRSRGLGNLAVQGKAGMKSVNEESLFAQMGSV